MAFEVDKIKREHILEAVNRIEKENISLNKSIRYDVIINEKKYPPKEILRLSYKIATGEDIGLIYGGDQVNLILQKLGFAIDIKNSFWKLGCNWGKGAPNFFKLLKNNDFVIGTANRVYRIGDIILITDGFTVIALAKVLEKPFSVTDKLDLRIELERYGIPFESNILISKVEILELNKNDIFLYQLQQGIVKVRSKNIIEKATNIWENYKKPYSNNYTFYLKEYHEKANGMWKYPCFVLESNSWKDYNYKTSFDLFYYRDITNRVEIGSIKILDKNSTITHLEKEFTELKSNFCSLAQTLNFHTKLRDELPDDYKKILTSLRECSNDIKIFKEFENNFGFKTSLIRSSEAEYLLNNVNDIINGNFDKIFYEFNFSFKLEGALDSHKVDFNFNNNKKIPNRFFCIVGKNATGKTKYISQLANKLADENEQGEFIPKRPYFSKIIASSFSYFDKFRMPERTDTNYEFIGVKNRAGIIKEEEYSNLIWKSYCNISNDFKKKELWLISIQSSLEINYLNFELNELFNISKKNEFIELTENIFSSGQNIIFQFITRFIECIEFNSLLIFDEPETHLHPNIAGRLIKTINNILNDYQSFCILSTHSPIIVQEIPSKFIRIFDRKDNMPIISIPTIECFGENLSTISNNIFKADLETELYKSYLEELTKHKTINEINSYFDDKLSLNARLFIQSVINENND